MYFPPSHLFPHSQSSRSQKNYQLHSYISQKTRSNFQLPNIPYPSIQPIVILVILNVLTFFYFFLSTVFAFFVVHHHLVPGPLHKSLYLSFYFFLSPFQSVTFVTAEVIFLKMQLHYVSTLLKISHCSLLVLSPNPHSLD